MRRKSALLALLLALSMSLPVFAGEEEIDAQQAAALVNSGIPCESAILVEQTTGQVLFEKNADESLAPASITKIMTLLLVVEALDRGEIATSDVVTCSAHAASMGGAQIWLKENEQMTVDELLRAVAISSANDAAVALGEFLSGTEEAFVAEMNRRAQALGMTHTTFQNATGLDAEGHRTTARDISVMARELLSHERIVPYSTTWMDSLRGGATSLVNTNKLIRHYKGATGLKTGTTDDAKYCLAASAERDSLALVAVVLGAPTTNDRFGAAKGLLDYGFSNYEMRSTPAIDPPLEKIPVRGGQARWVSLTADAPARFLAEKSVGEVEQEFTLPEEVAAPVKKGDVLGEAVLSSQGVLLCRYPLLAGEDVEVMTFLPALRLTLRAAAAMGRLPQE